MNTKKLYKSDTDVAIAGVCGGIAEYLEVDSVIIRLGTVILALAGGSGILIYLIAALIIPKKPTATYGGGGSYTRSDDSDSGVYYYGADGTRYENTAAGTGSASYASSAGDSDVPADEAGSDDFGPDIPAPGAALSGDSPHVQPGDRQHHTRGTAVVRKPSSGKKLLGGAAIAFGIFILLERYLNIDSTILFAVCLIGFGFFLLIKRD